ncbi:hypothetical protein Bca4012_085343 [Brassica carinata]
MKYVLVTGGVVSGLGKGVTASSIGLLLQACGLRVTSIKIDPYLNTDAGTMSPFEHGEVFVLDDGGEVDLDLGNYERFLDSTLTRDNNLTTGKIYQSVIDKERKGDYLGRTVQVVPHITDAIQEWIERVANVPVDGKEGPPDVCVIELGGTIGSKAGEADVTEWTARTKIYDTLQDPALLHASVACHKKLVVDWVAASDLEEITAQEAPDVHKAAWDLLKGADGILVPGGFGDRGVQGKILATKYARENQVPLLGICLGMQLAVVEFARSILGFEDANSTEFEPETPSPCVIFMPEGSTTHMGGTMRLGSRRTYFQVPDCKSAKLYGNAKFVDERHRHRYEVNPDMIQEIENAGLSFVGKDETGRRMENILKQTGLIAAASGCLETVLQASGKVSKVSSTTRVANGTAAGKVYQNGNVHSNGNGLRH